METIHQYPNSQAKSVNSETPNEMTPEQIAKQHLLNYFQGGVWVHQDYFHQREEENFITLE